MPADPTPASSTPTGGRTVTLSCPHCITTLRTAANVSVEDPCPKCGTTIRYVAPDAPAPPATFVPRKTRSSTPEEPEFEKPRSKPEPRERTPRGKRKRSLKRRVRSFFRTSAGRLTLCAVAAAFVCGLVFLFFKWDHQRHVTPDKPAPAGQPASPATGP